MAYTKTQLLGYFSELDLSVLEKLYKYSNLLIIPEEDLLTNATMTQMVDKAHELADSLFPEWTDRSKTDFGEFIIELLALFSEKNFWYLNAFANESLLQKMRSYSNLYLKASELGYQARLCKGSSTSFRLFFRSGESVLYGRGDLVVKIGSLEFSNDSEILIESSDIEQEVIAILHEGKQTVDNAIFNGHSVYLRQEMIDIDSISLRLGELTYDRVYNFGQSSQNSPHYIVIPEENGSASIFFGSDGFGVTPQIGTSMEIVYRTCSGSSGNIVSQETYVSSSLSSRECFAAFMISDSYGGVDPESFSSIRNMAPLFFTTKKSVINEKSAISILNGFSFVKNSNAFLTGSVLNYQVIPISGDSEPSLEERTVLGQEFEPYIMMGYVCHYTENQYVDLLNRIDPDATHFVLDVTFLRSRNTVSAETSLRQIIQDFTNPLINASYGGSFNRTNTEIKMRSVPGVQSVLFKKRISGTDTLVTSDITIGSREIFSTFDQDKLVVLFTII